MESEKDIFSSSREGREVGYESKEAEMDPELQAAATMERADYLVKEVKSSKQQMQNIVMHMTQVKQAIQQIRKQLQLQASDDTSSVERDEARVAALQQQIAEHKDELLKMKDDLVRVQMEELASGVGATWAAAKRQAKAEEMVAGLLSEVDGT